MRSTWIMFLPYLYLYSKGPESAVPGDRRRKRIQDDEPEVKVDDCTREQPSSTAPR